MSRYTLISMFPEEPIVPPPKKKAKVVKEVKDKAQSIPENSSRFDFVLPLLPLDNVKIKSARNICTSTKKRKSGNSKRRTRKFALASYSTYTSSVLKFKLRECSIKLVDLKHWSSMKNVALHPTVTVTLDSNDIPISDDLEEPPVDVHPDFSDEFDRLFERVVIPLDDSESTLGELPSDIEWDSQCEWESEVENEDNGRQMQKNTNPIPVRIPMHYEEDDMDVLVLTVDPNDILPMP